MKRLRGRHTAHPYARIDWSKAAVLFQKPLSKEPDTNERYASVKQILRILAVIGAVGLVCTFPTIAIALKPFLPEERRWRNWRLKQTLEQLARQKYVIIRESTDGKVTIAITRHGMTRALSYELDTMSITPSKRWDGLWRVVIFDIPEAYKRMRDMFRMRLVQLGMYQLQESVYVSPYPCFDEVEFLRELYDVAITARYLLVQKIEDDATLRERFHLRA
ncbi:hypothetical protein HY411_01090 [Candidatus Gottesmanbacteria bacterium]|nr:hypothetical protein [Candidatus Gottesmanbacteria bacterium]